MLNIPKQRNRVGGFSLLEVLVSILVLSIGLLGAAGMLTRAIENSTDTERRQMAAMLASEFMETMRADVSHIFDQNGTLKNDLGGYVTDGISSGICDSTSNEPSSRLQCWAKRTKELMPEIENVKHSIVLESAGIVSVTVVWPVKEGQCLADDLPPNADYCYYTLRSKL